MAELSTEQQLHNCIENVQTKWIEFANHDKSKKLSEKVKLEEYATLRKEIVKAENLNNKLKDELAKIVNENKEENKGDSKDSNRSVDIKRHIDMLELDENLKLDELFKIVSFLKQVNLDLPKENTVNANVEKTVYEHVDEERDAF